MQALARLAVLTTLALVSASAAPIAFAQHYTQVNLVSNTSGVAPVTDPNLVNPWGLSRASGSPWWISDNGTGLSTLYNGAGAITPLVVTIPKADPKSTTFPVGTPTGTIANGSSTDFLLAAGKPAVFLFSTIDGTISGWNPAVGIAPGGAPPSTHATIVVKTIDGSSFTGLTSASISGHNYLYVANFTKGSVDVYSNIFHKITLPNVEDNDNADNDHGKDDDSNDKGHKPFTDSQLPPDYVPFNVQAIGNDIVVTFVLHPAGSPFETDGEGLGYVDIFSSTGQLLQRLEHGPWLNAPWGIALAPLDFGGFSHALLIGNFAGGSATGFGGTIDAYDLASGALLGVVADSTNKSLVIPGLWAISPGNSGSSGSYDPAGAPGSELYFTAGPDHGTGGLFGYLKPVSTELTKGNNQ
jgi:uncharacterized protein (TIGR03118 family)